MNAREPRGSRLEGKVALVTGAGSRPGDGVGTGKAISVQFAREGARVVLLDINETQVAETLVMIEAEGGEAMVFIGDVTRESVCEAAVRTATERFGPVTTLVNNVAVTAPKADVSETPGQVWDHVLETNVKSAMLMTKHAVPVMAQRGGGSIINIASVVALRGHPQQTPYSASKGALVSLTTLWAMEQGPHGIRVNCICPGNIYTPVAVSTFSSNGQPSRVGRRRMGRRLGSGVLGVGRGTLDQRCHLAGRWGLSGRHPAVGLQQGGRAPDGVRRRQSQRESR